MKKYASHLSRLGDKLGFAFPLKSIIGLNWKLMGEDFCLLWDKIAHSSDQIQRETGILIIVIITTQEAETNEKEFNWESKKKTKPPPKISVFPRSSFLPFRNIYTWECRIYSNFQ